MEKPFRKKPDGDEEEGGERGGVESLLLWKTRCFFVNIFGEWGMKTLLKKAYRLEEGLSSLVTGKQTPRRQVPPLFAQTFQEFGL